MISKQLNNFVYPSERSLRKQPAICEGSSGDRAKRRLLSQAIQNAENLISEDKNFKISRGSMPPDPPTCSRLRQSLARNPFCKTWIHPRLSWYVESNYSITCTRASASHISAVSFMITFKPFSLIWPSELTLCPCGLTEN